MNNFVISQENWKIIQQQYPQLEGDISEFDCNFHDVLKRNKSLITSDLSDINSRVNLLVMSILQAFSKELAEQRKLIDKLKKAFADTESNRAKELEDYEKLIQSLLNESSPEQAKKLIENLKSIIQKLQSTSENQKASYDNLRKTAREAKDGLDRHQQARSFDSFGTTIKEIVATAAHKILQVTYEEWTRWEKYSPKKRYQALKEMIERKSSYRTSPYYDRVSDRFEHPYGTSKVNFALREESLSTFSYTSLREKDRDRYGLEVLDYSEEFAEYMKQGEQQARETGFLRKVEAPVQKDFIPKDFENIFEAFVEFLDSHAEQARKTVRKVEAPVQDIIKQGVAATIRKDLDDFMKINDESDEYSKFPKNILEVFQTTFFRVILRSIHTNQAIICESDYGGWCHLFLRLKNVKKIYLLLQDIKQEDLFDSRTLKSRTSLILTKCYHYSWAGWYGRYNKEEWHTLDKRMDNDHIDILKSEWNCNEPTPDFLYNIWDSSCDSSKEDDYLFHIMVAKGDGRRVTRRNIGGILLDSELPREYFCWQNYLPDQRYHYLRKFFNERLKLSFQFVETIGFGIVFQQIFPEFSFIHLGKHNIDLGLCSLEHPHCVLKKDKDIEKIGGYLYKNNSFSLEGEWIFHDEYIVPSTVDLLSAHCLKLYIRRGVQQVFLLAEIDHEQKENEDIHLSIEHYLAADEYHGPKLGKTAKKTLPLIKTKGKVIYDIANFIWGLRYNFGSRHEIQYDHQIRLEIPQHFKIIALIIK